MLSPMKTCYLIIAHGSREREANQAFFEFLERFRQASQPRLVEGAFLELAKPSIPEGIEACIAKGAREIIILPMMFFPGRHVKEDVPRFIEEAKHRHPEVDFHYASPVSENPMLVSLLEENAEQIKMKGRS